MKKLLIFFVTFVITLSVNQTAFADESKNTSDESKNEVAQLIIKYQKEDIDNIVNSGSRSVSYKINSLSKYKVDGEYLTAEQKSELLEYKSEAAKKLKEQTKKDEKFYEYLFFYIGLVVLIMVILIFNKED